MEAKKWGETDAYNAFEAKTGGHGKQNLDALASLWTTGGNCDIHKERAKGERLCVCF